MELRFNYIEKTEKGTDCALAFADEDYEALARTHPKSKKIRLKEARNFKYKQVGRFKGPAIIYEGKIGA